MKKITFLLIISLIAACSEKQPDLIVRGHIKDLKKGTIYLKKVKDTALATVDSIVINGDSHFELYSDLDSPEIFFLYLNKNSSEEDRITFFADKGVTEINTSLKNFVYDAKINGSAQQKTLEKYLTIMDKMKDRDLDLIKEHFEAQKNNDTAKIKAIEKESNNSLKRKYLYTVNFALNNRDSEVAPYLALTEVYNARITFLDTINNSLSPKVKKSKYGKELQSFIDNIKENQQN